MVSVSEIESRWSEGVSGAAARDTWCKGISAIEGIASCNRALQDKWETMVSGKGDKFISHYKRAVSG